MVSLIAPGSSRDPRGRLFPRRRTQPWLVLVAFLAVAGVFVWILVLNSGEDAVGAMNCSAPTHNAPGAPPPVPLGERKSPAALNDVEPAALGATKVRVFNANNEKGQAGQIAEKLGGLGYSSAPDVQIGNDPVYVDQNMQCFSQIRFGPNGRAAAASVQLAAPCSELIEDKRSDDTVDLALGALFRDVHPNNDATEVLQELRNLAPGTKAPRLDAALLAAARNGKC